MTFPEDPINNYPQGQRIKLFVDFKNAAGVAANPDTTQLEYIDGAGTKTTVLQASLTNPAAGRWEFQLQLPQDGDRAGAWSYRFEGTSAASSNVNAAAGQRFNVRPSPFYPPS